MLNVNDCDEYKLKVLKEFQKRVDHVEQDEITCLRFLIAREFKMEQAETMLRNNVAWRKEIGIENYLKWTPSGFNIPEEDLGFNVAGVSHIGGPVLYLPLGKWKARYWIERGKQDELTHFVYHVLETALTRMKESNNKQIVLILGMEMLTYYQVSHIPSLKTLYTSFQALEQNYPEILQKLVVINAPWVFSIAFNFIKPILSKRTLNKIQVFGCERDSWLPALRELVPDSAIPSDYLKDV